MDTGATKQIHEGRNVKRFREMLGIKQEALAAALGDDWNQKKISLLEAKDKLEAGILKDVANALKVPVEAIQNFDEEAAINIIGNTVTTVNDNATGQLFQIQPTFNPIDKWVEALEENKQLYERLLQAEREKVALLEQLLRK
ncbi:MAG: helix-turn-helix transcriptional regulator [Chitinophagaceae bacterium]|nr:helix-turn-helix transcriptional regulator [Chitinophagaceae bacterium]